jgi:hypothetical protein
MKKQTIKEHPLANLSIIEMEAAIPKLDRCLLQLREFDIQTIQTGYEPSLQALSQKVHQLLIDLFGNNSHEYYRYNSFSTLTTVSLSVDPRVRSWTKDNLEQIINQSKLYLGGKGAAIAAREFF